LGVTADGAWEFVLQDLGFPYAAAPSPSRAMSDAQSPPPLPGDGGTLSILEWDPEIGDFNVVSNLTCPTEGYPDFELGAFASFPIPLISPQP
jgi:hypothetical protein